MEVTTKAKAWVSALGLLVTSLSGAFADNVLNGNEVAGIASTLVLGALSVYAVYRVPNKPVPPQ
jgi:hypothetical protein